MIIRTLLWAQLLELRRNSVLLMMGGMPLLMAFFFRIPVQQRPDTVDMFLPLALMMALFMVGWQMPSVGLGEEKEKRTLETLLLTPARPSQIILARGLAAAILGLVTGGGIVLLFQQAVDNWFMLVVAYLFGLLFTISGGLFVGMMMPDQRSASMVGTFSMLLLAFSALPPLEMAFPTYWKYAAYMPARPMQELLGLGLTGQIEDLWQHTAVLSVYTLIALGLCVSQMRKQVGLR